MYGDASERFIIWKEAGWEGGDRDVVRLNFSVDSLKGWH